MTSSLTGQSLHRSRERRLIAGVAGGVAEVFDLDVTLVRLAVVVLTLAAGIGVPLYVAAWLLVPEAGSSTSIAQELLHDGWR